MKNRVKLFIFTTLAIIISSVFIQAQEAQAENKEEIPKNEVQFNFSTESLTRNLGTWRTASLFLQRKLKNRQIVWANYRLSDRNGTRDQEFVVGTYKPLAKKWAFTAEAMVSPSRKFVGKYSVLGEVEKGFKKGLVLHAGVRYTSYTTIKATTAYGLIEKYWGTNRAAYTLYISTLTNAGTAPTHRFQYSHYYGEKVNSFGGAISFGREHENLGSLLGILKSKTVSIAFSEKHWLTDKIGINVDASLHRQGTSYYRRGLNVGIRYRF
jgi:YaiO family outer membrane protein